jgi:hypothetical protein
MIRKPFSAFGRILYANYYEAGYTGEAATFSASDNILFFSEGSFTVLDKITGEVVHELVPGAINMGEYEDRMFNCVCNVASVFWCYDPKVNQNYIPVIDSLIIKRGESVALPTGTNLFLCSGTLQINDATCVAPRQIHVRSVGTTATATEDVYGLVFK